MRKYPSDHPSPQHPRVEWPTQHRVQRMATLIELPGQRAHAVGAHTTIGRSEACQIRVDDPMVSAAHAEIIRTDDGTYHVRDLGSRRGTFVGNRKVTDARLRHGDELMIGAARLRFEDSAAQAVSDDQELVRLRAVVELTRAVGVEHDLERVLERVLATCFQLLRADRAAIVVYGPSSKSPFMTVTKSRDGDEDDFAVSSSVLGQVMVTHQPYLNTEVDSDVVLQRSASLSAHNVRSVMAVPLRYQADETEWLGLIQVDSTATSNVFGPKELELLEAIAGPTALAIKNAMLVRQVQSVIGDEGRRLERVVRDLPLGVVVLDENRVCTMVNRWVTKRNEDLGEIRPGCVTEVIAGIPCETLVAANVRTQITNPDSERTFSVVANTTNDGRESVIVINDITEERERQNQIAHRDRVALIGQLAGGIAHDFNNLLHVIMTYANMLEESLENADARDDAHQITHAATSAAELTKQLLSFSRRELVKPRVIDVTRVVTGMEKLLLRTIGQQIQLVTSIAPRMPRILIDSAQLEQILMNLVVNARDAMPNGGRVELRVNTVDVDVDRANARAIGPGRYVAIEVADSGGGIPPNVIARIFEPYFSTKARGKGTGLGLATVHGIVQHAGGDIVVESQLGQGTLFRILLPATELAGDVTRDIPLVKDVVGTVLVVDDDDSVRRVTERLLRSCGFTVLRASSGPDALAVAGAHKGNIDLLLTDIVMPGMSGRDLARDLGAQRPSMKILFMSGYHQHSPLADSQFLTKPFHRGELLEKVRTMLSERDVAVKS
ncbi:MAG: ATP-binding protein [Myxococcota bacterium]|nr:ATP-binding protein [Myxococcota bacterium]